MHHSTPRIAVALACLGIGFTATVVAQGPGAAPAAQAKIKLGVVDIGFLFKSYGRKDDLEQGINKEREEMKKQLEADEARLIELRKNMGTLYKPGSEQWELQADKLRLDEQALQLKKQRLERLLKKRIEELTLQVLGELEATIGTYGDQHEFTLICKVDKSAREEAVGALAEQFQERIFRAQISDVLYYHGSIDCTQGVLSLLNSPENKRRMEKLAAGAPPTGANKPGGN